MTATDWVLVFGLSAGLILGVATATAFWAWHSLKPNQAQTERLADGDMTDLAAELYIASAIAGAMGRRGTEHHFRTFADALRRYELRYDYELEIGLRLNKESRDKFEATQSGKVAK